jgi:hypothetical protein
MRLINSVVGAIAFRVSTDEVMPKTGLVFEELIKFVGNMYNFSVRPQIPQGVAPISMQPFIFQSGAAEIDRKKVPVFTLAVLPTGYIVVSTNTDLADKIMSDYLKRLDSELGYRNASAKSTRKSYVSNIVVEFEEPLGQKIKPVNLIEQTLKREIGSLEFPLKRLAFGAGPTILPGIPASLEVIEKADFIIEIREGEPYIKNRYFSAAPTTTSEHIRILEVIERELNAKH